MQQAIEDIGKDVSGLEKICFAPMTTADEEPKVSQCVVQSLFGYFGNSMEDFNKSVEDDKGYTINYLNKLDKCMM